MTHESPTQLELSIEPVDSSMVPPEAMGYFLAKSIELNRHPIEDAQGFEHLSILAYEGLTSFVAQETKTYPNGDIERLLYIYDYEASGQAVGEGELRFAINRTDDYFRNKPFVGMTRTFPGHQRRGYGGRRLKLMDQLSQQFYGLRLHSDTNISDAARHLWDHLVEDGSAIQYREGEYTRYTFV